MAAPVEQQLRDYFVDVDALQGRVDVQAIVEPPEIDLDRAAPVVSLAGRRRRRWLLISAAAAVLVVAALIGFGLFTDDDTRTITDTPSTTNPPTTTGSTTTTTDGSTTTALVPELGTVDVSGVVEPVELGEFLTFGAIVTDADSLWATSFGVLDATAPGQLLRMNPATGATEEAAPLPPVIGRRPPVVSDNAVWVLDLDDPQRLSRLDAQSLAVVAEIELPLDPEPLPAGSFLGAPPILGAALASGDSVWVVVTYEKTAGAAAVEVIRVDATTNVVVDTVEVDDVPILNGILPPDGRIAVAPSGSVYVAAQRSQVASSIWKIDPATNATAGSVSVDGIVDQLLASDDAVWAVAAPLPGSDRENLIRVDQSMTLPPAASFPAPATQNLGGAVLLDEVLLVSGEDGIVYRINARSGVPETALDVGELDLNARQSTPATMVMANGWVWLQGSDVWRAPVGAFLEGG